MLQDAIPKVAILQVGPLALTFGDLAGICAPLLNEVVAVMIGPNDGADSFFPELV
jgi:hypothetical protein